MGNSAAAWGTLTAFSPGTYWVEVSNICDNAVGTDTIHISFSDFEIDLNHLGESYVCSSELPFTLHAPEGYEDYFWSDGQSSSSIYVDSVGVYALTVVNAQGCVALDTLWVDHCIGIIGLEDEGFRVFPNPTEGAFSISGLPREPGYLRMYSMDGQLVLQYPLQPDGDVVVKTSHLAEGIYVVEWMSGVDVLRRKVALTR